MRTSNLVQSNIVNFSLILSNEIDGENYEMDGVKHKIDVVNNKIDGGNHVKYFVVYLSHT